MVTINVKDEFSPLRVVIAHDALNALWGALDAVHPGSCQAGCQPN